MSRVIWEVAKIFKPVAELTAVDKRLPIFCNSSFGSIHIFVASSNVNVPCLISNFTGLGIIDIGLCSPACKRGYIKTKVRKINTTSFQPMSALL